MGCLFSYLWEGKGCKKCRTFLPWRDRAQLRKDWRKLGPRCIWERGSRSFRCTKMNTKGGSWVHLNLNMKALINMQSHLSKNYPVISPYVGTKLTSIVMEMNIDTSQNACVYMHASIHKSPRKFHFVLYVRSLQHQGKEEAGSELPIENGLLFTWVREVRSQGRKRHWKEQRPTSLYSSLASSGFKSCLGAPISTCSWVSWKEI